MNSLNRPYSTEKENGYTDLNNSRMKSAKTRETREIEYPTVESFSSTINNVRSSG